MPKGKPCCSTASAPWSRIRCSWPEGGYALTGSTDQFALMPFFSPGTPCDWDRLYMVCYIGLNKHLGEPQNKKKYDPVMQLMDYISTPEGQLALAADTGPCIPA